MVYLFTHARRTIAIRTSSTTRPAGGGLLDLLLGGLLTITETATRKGGGSRAAERSAGRGAPRVSFSRAGIDPGRGSALGETCALRLQLADAGSARAASIASPAPSSPISLSRRRPGQGRGGRAGARGTPRSAAARAGDLRVLLQPLEDRRLLDDVLAQQQHLWDPGSAGQARRARSATRPATADRLEEHRMADLLGEEAGQHALAGSPSRNGRAKRARRRRARSQARRTPPRRVALREVDLDEDQILGQQGRPLPRPPAAETAGCTRADPSSSRERATGHGQHAFFRLERLDGTEIDHQVLAPRPLLLVQLEGGSRSPERRPRRHCRASGRCSSPPPAATTPPAPAAQTGEHRRSPPPPAVLGEVERDLDRRRRRPGGGTDPTAAPPRRSSHPGPPARGHRPPPLATGARAQIGEKARPGRAGRARPRQAAAPSSRCRTAGRRPRPPSPANGLGLRRARPARSGWCTER